MRWRSFGLVVVLAATACQKPNLESTEGGYSRRSVASSSAAPAARAPAEAAAPIDTTAPADAASPAAADTATP